MNIEQRTRGMEIDDYLSVLYIFHAFNETPQEPDRIMDKATEEYSEMVVAFCAGGFNNATAREAADLANVAFWIMHQCGEDPLTLMGAKLVETTEKYHKSITR